MDTAESELGESLRNGVKTAGEATRLPQPRQSVQVFNDLNFS